MSIFARRITLTLAVVSFGAAWIISYLPLRAQPSPATTVPSNLDALVNQPVDIASSAYQYRADRKADENPPESWLPLLHFAKLPLNKPLDVNAPAIKQVLCGLLWEEIRPIQKLELTWAPDAKHQPDPAELMIETLDAQGSASSWWNNLLAVRQNVAPTISTDKKTYVYDLGRDTCGLVIALPKDKVAADYDVPTVRVLVSDLWKSMDVELEWGFEQSTATQDYSGRIETYDGKIADLRSLADDNLTKIIDPTQWQSNGTGPARRGVRFRLLYMGTSKWRKVQPFTSQPDDVARTIVTLWTSAGNMSFLAADLENGPILAPEYGFFLRRTSELSPPSSPQNSPQLQIPAVQLSSAMNSIAGNKSLRGWSGEQGMPWFGGNPTDHAINAQGIELPPKSLAMHPAPDRDVAVDWISPIAGVVNVSAKLRHAQSNSNGVEWFIVRNDGTERKILAQGVTGGIGSLSIPGEEGAAALNNIAVARGNTLSLLIGPYGDYQCDSTVIDLNITEVGAGNRTWDVTRDVIDSIDANPHADGQGNADVWRFSSLQSRARRSVLPAQPPIELASNATSAREFIRELHDRKLSSIREQTRLHPEQTWEGAVTTIVGADLPPHPTAPPEFQSPMKVQVPSERLTAQWNLGAWHLLRHAGKHPTTGRLWFDDYPYGILAAETYLILSTLDQLGLHEAAADGLDQWLSLPMDTKSDKSRDGGHHFQALSDRPTGLFADGYGCLTNAVGPKGAGGHMDAVHAFGPGSIGWALAGHASITGDLTWLKAAAPRIKANAEWMLRQRQLISHVMPGGDRLWCKGLQPPLQVTPDSGGLWVQFYEAEAYYWASIARFAEVLRLIDPEGGGQLATEAESYRKDLLAAVNRSITLSPVVPIRDGTFHSVIPFACYVRGLSTGAWGWLRDGSGGHVGPLYWETVQSAAPLVNPAGLLSTDDVRVQGYLDVLEDRLLLENTNAGQRSHGEWFSAGWQYQGGLERTANLHLAADDIPVFLRSFLNCYAADILPADGYIFNEHTVHGPPDKIFEEAAFLERFRNLLVMEDGQNLWLARGAARAWFDQGKEIKVANAPTHFGTMGYAITSDVDHGTISATIDMPSRSAPENVRLRLRHPRSAPMESVTVNGKPWEDFDAKKELVTLHGLKGEVKVTVHYGAP